MDITVYYAAFEVYFDEVKIKDKEGMGIKDKEGMEIKDKEGMECTRI